MHTVVLTRQEADERLQYAINKSAEVMARMREMIAKLEQLPTGEVCAKCPFVKAAA